jgi:hypothetical protein
MGTHTLQCDYLKGHLLHFIIIANAVIDNAAETTPNYITQVKAIRTNPLLHRFTVTKLALPLAITPVQRAIRFHTRLRGLLIGLDEFGFHLIITNITNNKNEAIHSGCKDLSIEL